MTHTEHLTKYVGHFIEGLAQSGVTDAVISPGSRSTPLAVLFAEHPTIKEWVIVDERSAAFFALGLAKQTKRPVALICTSGTAAANYYPAIVEAHYSRVPLIVLTADRPHELRDVGAPQAIEQIKMYGDYAKWFHDMALPEATPSMLNYVRNKAVRAVHMSQEGTAGIVHLNFPFREPLMPDVALQDKWTSAPKHDNQRFAFDGQNVLSEADIHALINLWASGKKGLFVCGPQPDQKLANAIIGLASEWGWPILADPLSQLRTTGEQSPVIIDTYDAFLKDREIRERLQADVIVRFGAMPVSKSYLFYIQELTEAAHFVVEKAQGHREPVGLPSQFIYADPVLLCETLKQKASGQNAEPDWLQQWQDMQQTASTHIGKASETLTEGDAVNVLVEAVPENETVYVGNSMAVRDLDTFLINNTKQLNILANRGANGIDGMLSSGLGAAASGQHVTLLLGDLSFYHDMNGLLAAKHYPLNMTVLVINNNGGGIFSFLPQANEPKHFEALFGTPLHIDFKHTAALYELNYDLVDNQADLLKSLKNSYEQKGVTIVEVQTNRADNAQMHKQLWQDIADDIKT
ncbi:2-succinyl-5-enolpyruvyl-6-hydroxy-3-cyclohexene-1-carboxylic-acid synthase [Lentibacillus saliphilus]|uniref:2-succinyl-5-enolpyruvyl-6-hydroxy-3- cyclohexene-1-carboxylic-acid synthase n=1 Tax=Lentibacillus saliphilus TaxID=2737028 RepID=UPI001C30BB4C|nr:2-succinyl-5-enolpyruvyl-6-hydroxy-3-cyclohexene-1-carboxylic-acid synthase [Lentibacillus saliphilus]